jgi:hypothetical protein
MRKFELIKLVMLRQYQRRILRYAKKYVIEPLPSDEEPKMTAAELLEEQMENVNRVIEGAKGGDKLDKKILKRLIPEDIYERNFPNYAEKAAQRKEKLLALKQKAMNAEGRDPTSAQILPINDENTDWQK